MKHIKDFKLFEFGENPGFEEIEIQELEKLGFKYIDGECINDKGKGGSTLIIRKDSTSYKGVIDEWFVLTIKYDKFFNQVVKNAQYFKDFDASLAETKQESFDTFEDLLKTLKIYL